MRRWLIGLGACAALGAGCDDGDGDGPAPTDVGMAMDMGGMDANPDEDMRPPLPDLGTDAAMPTGCFNRGGALLGGFESEPLPGAFGLRADVDPDADGQPDVVVTYRDPNGLRLALHDGRSFEALGQAVLAQMREVRFMTDAWPQTGLLTPLPGDLYGAWAWSDVEHRLYAIRATDFEPAPIVLPKAAERVRFLSLGEKALAVVDYADQGCALYDLGAGALIRESGLCRIQPAWDVNGDDVPELAIASGEGTALLDVASDALAASTELRFVLGPEPADLRGLGPEVVGFLQGRQGAPSALHFLDPVELTSNEEIAIPGDFTRVEVHRFGDEQRVLLEEERLSLKYIRIIEPNAMARRRAELGSYRELSWRVGADADNDGNPDIQVVGGSTEDGTNTDITWFRMQDGRQVYTIEAERSARFVPALAVSGKGPVPVDLDGCEGVDHVALRQGGESAAGTRPTRIHIYGTDERIVWRSEPYTSFAHALAVADLDGVPPAELIELRADEEDGARIRVYRAILE